MTRPPRSPNWRTKRGRPCAKRRSSWAWLPPSSSTSGSDRRGWSDGKRTLSASPLHPDRSLGEQLLDDLGYGGWVILAGDIGDLSILPHDDIDRKRVRSHEILRQGTIGPGLLQPHVEGNAQRTAELLHLADLL